MNTPDMTTAPVSPDARTSGGDRCQPSTSNEKGLTIMTQPDDIPLWKQRRDLKPSPAEKVQPWNPWQALVEDYPDWRLVTAHRLDDRTTGLTSKSRKTIWLCNTLDEIHKTETLAHELVHIELGIWNGYGEHRSADYAERERIVVEVTARRLIPFRHLARVMVERPDATLGNWSALLRVTALTLSERFITLSPVERAALSQVRGGPLPTVPSVELWDGEEAA